MRQSKGFPDLFWSVWANTVATVMLLGKTLNTCSWLELVCSGLGSGDLVKSSHLATNKGIWSFSSIYSLFGIYSLLKTLELLELPLQQLTVLY